MSTAIRDMTERKGGRARIVKRRGSKPNMEIGRRADLWRPPAMIFGSTHVAHSDPASERQVLHNMPANAAKHTHTGWVELRRDRRAAFQGQ